MVVLVVGVNTYGTLAEADAYLEASIRAAETWAGTDEDTKKRGMVTAFRLIEKQLLQGTPTGVSIVQAAAVDTPGTGYAVGDVLTVLGGTSGQPALLEVLTLSTTAVATVRPIDVGTYTEAPTSPASTSGGTGTGATFTLTMGAQLSHFPVTGVTCEGVAVDEDTYPEDLKQAQFELAYELVVQGGVLETSAGSGSNVKGVGAGSARVDFFRPTDNLQRFPTVVQELLRCFLGGSGGVGAFASGGDGESFFKCWPDNYGLVSGEG